MAQVFGQRFTTGQGGAGHAHGGGGLDTVTALRGDPEEVRHLRVETADQIAIGDKGAQAGPSVRRATDAQAGVFLDLVDAQGNIQFFRLYIVGLDRVCMGEPSSRPASGLK